MNSAANPARTMSPEIQALVIRNLANDMKARIAAGATRKQLRGIYEEFCRAQRGEW
jgi:hypothetical protein